MIRLTRRDNPLIYILPVVPVIHRTTGIFALHIIFMADFSSLRLVSTIFPWTDYTSQVPSDCGINRVLFRMLQKHLDTAAASKSLHLVEGQSRDIIRIVFVVFSKKRKQGRDKPVS